MLTIRPRAWALLVGIATNALCALVFWFVLGVVQSRSLVSFWNRPPAVVGILMLLFLMFGARVLIWYARKVDRYKRLRGRGAVRILPLAFGLAVFGMVVTWLGVTFVAEAGFRTYRLAFASAALDRTVVFLPLVFFIQFLFSHSTVVWLLAAGVLWTAAARLGRTRRPLLAYYDPPAEAAPEETRVAFVRIWNLVGYLILILSLLFQI